MIQGIKSIAKKMIPESYHSTLSYYYHDYGFAFKCIFCQVNLRKLKLKPFGPDLPVLKEKAIVGAAIRNTICHRCNSFDRGRLIYLYLMHRTRLFRNDVRLLHIAPEERLRKVLMTSPNINYFSADFQMQSVMVKLDITNIGCKDNLFDVIICNHVLEHIQDDRKAMSELYRVLKSDGFAILQVPISLLLETTYEDPALTSREEREKTFGQCDHVRIYALDYRNRLEEVGFQAEEFKWTENLKDFGGKKNKYGLIKDEILYICRKSKY